MNLIDFNMKNIYKALGLGALALTGAVVLAGCDNVKNKLDKRRTGEEIIYISEGDTYTGYVGRVREKYPEQVKDVRTDDLWMYISKMNKDKPLVYYKDKATTTVLPKF